MQESDRGACVRGRGARRGPPPKVFIDMLHEYPARLCAVQPHELCCPMILLELVVSLRLNFRKPPGNGLLAMWIGLLRFAMKMASFFRSCEVSLKAPLFSTQRPSNLFFGKKLWKTEKRKLALITCLGTTQGWPVHAGN